VVALLLASPDEVALGAEARHGLERALLGAAARPTGSPAGGTSGTHAPPEPEARESTCLLLALTLTLALTWPSPSPYNPDPTPDPDANPDANPDPDPDPGTSPDPDPDPGPSPDQAREYVLRCRAARPQLGATSTAQRMYAGPR
jgi:hypothetical protein